MRRKLQEKVGQMMKEARGRRRKEVIITVVRKEVKRELELQLTRIFPQ